MRQERNMSVWLERSLDGDIDDSHPMALATPYTASGFIVWCCFVSVCCGAPLLCLSCWFLYKRCQGEFCENEVVEAADLDLHRSRIEANISAFSEIEKKIKKTTLLKAFENHTEVRI